MVGPFTSKEFVWLSLTASPPTNTYQKNIIFIEYFWDETVQKMRKHIWGNFPVKSLNRCVVVGQITSVSGSVRLSTPLNSVQKHLLKTSHVVGTVLGSWNTMIN